MIVSHTANSLDISHTDLLSHQLLTDHPSFGYHHHFYHTFSELLFVKILVTSSLNDAMVFPGRYLLGGGINHTVRETFILILTIINSNTSDMCSVISLHDDHYDQDLTMCPILSAYTENMKTIYPEIPSITPDRILFF